MKRNLVTVNEASYRTGLSPLQIHALMRNNILRPVICDDKLFLEMRMLRRWINYNESLVRELRKESDERRLDITLINYIIHYGKKGNC